MFMILLQAFLSAQATSPLHDLDFASISQTHTSKVTQICIQTTDIWSSQSIMKDTDRLFTTIKIYPEGWMILIPLGV